VPRTFADAAYYIALLSRLDEHHALALAYDEDPSFSRVVTSDAVLVEVFAYFSGAGQRHRLAVAILVDRLRSDPRVTIIHQTPELFFAGVDLYRRRLDKGYSLTDCMSMVLCREQEIAGVLTHDRHFEQEGFAVLL
jgi:predicted nucleic acid-binding protein